MKYVLFVAGILILTLGISFTIQSELGTSPFDALLVGLSQNVGLSVGSWEVIIAFLLIGFNSLLKQQKPELLGLITAFITGIGIDIWLYVSDSLITPEVWYTKLMTFVIGLVIISIGTAIYLQTNFAPIPIDRLTLILHEVTRTPLFMSRTFIYLVFLILAFQLSGPIWIGTLLTVCFAGLLLQFIMGHTKKIIDRILTDMDTSSSTEHEKEHSI
ncbi:YitT family protein [Paenibacillus sp. W2I17]|uniref:YczE/YyaS/YitT family protein n=1 Tax=Paenibacillus sp. W2I17 TaxID=3042311 RepID=UPI00278B9EF6|nr:YitT family protein [Paenibacillus sp. W2I17]MDQ0655840.1 putative membrane protein YczE [Paenibacillus sp. W2I17]